MAQGGWARCLVGSVGLVERKQGRLRALSILGIVSEVPPQAERRAASFAAVVKGGWARCVVGRVGLVE
eukprot:4496451-Prymnesium_polylepis.1